MPDIRIVLYDSLYKNAFISLNKEWITTYFRLEKSDIEVLNNLEEYIINNQGQIFIALLNNEPVGCCALLYHPNDNTYELGKMAVAPSAQKLGIGRLLGESLIEYAKREGVTSIYLEANTKLEASVALYKKLGFRAVDSLNSAYERCNLMMIIDL